MRPKKSCWIPTSSPRRTSSSAWARSWSATIRAMLAYTVDFTGFRQYGLQVKNLRTGETLPDTTERVDSVVWAADNQTLFLTTEDAVTKRGDKLWRHVLGSASYEPLYDEKDELYDIRIDKTRDKKYILLGIDSKDTTEFRWLRADHPRDHFAVFLPREKKHRYYVDHRENLFYIRTNKDGRNFAIMTAPENDPAPEELEGFHPAAGRCADRGHGSVPGFRRVAWKGRKRSTTCACMTSTPPSGRAFPFPEPVYAASPGGTPEFDFEDLSLQLPELHHASQRLRLRRAQRPVHAAETAGSAGRLRSHAVRLASACGPPRATA